MNYDPEKLPKSKSLLHFTPFGLSVLCVSLLTASGLLGSWLARQPAAAISPQAAATAQQAELPADTPEMPWGRLIMQDIDLEQPDEYVSFEETIHRITQWVFKGMTVAEIRETLQECQLAREHISDCMAPERVKDSVLSVTVTPTDDAVLALSAVGRAKLYTLLSQWPENRYMLTPYQFEPKRLAARLAENKIPSTARDLVGRLMYERGGLGFFSDPEIVLRGLDDAAVRQLFMRTLTSRKAVAARLDIRPDSNIDTMMGYWGHLPGVDQKDLRPLLEALRRRPEGANLSILHLLPRFARERLFTFPYAGEEGQIQADCHWTALNFFSDKPDDRLLDNAYASQLIKEEYFPIGQPSRCGDLIFLLNAQGAVIHSAVYIAADLCFTKNGVNFAQPWILMRMQDLSDVYTVLEKPKVLFYRRK